MKKFFGWNHPLDAKKKIPCPMCFGEKFVAIVLGNGVSEKIQCGFCERGCNSPSGTVTVWEPRAVVKSGTIEGVSTRDGIRYEVGYSSIEEGKLFKKEDEANIECKKQYEIEVSRSETWFKGNFVNAKKKQIWSAGYHKKCIKDAEKTISWHKLRLGMIKERES